MSYVRGRATEALETVGPAIELLRAHGEPGELGRALWLQGAAAHGTDDYELAVDSYERAIDLLRQGGSDATAGRVVGSLAEARRRLGDLDGAVAAARESAAIAERAGDKEAHAYALAHVAYYDLRRGDREGAAREVVAALDVASAGGGTWATAIALLFASQVALAYERESDAAVLLGSAHATFDSVGEDRWDHERDDWEPTMETLRERLGTGLEPLLGRGRELRPDEAVTLARTAIPT